MGKGKMEIVTVCQRDGQWGFLLECGDFVAEHLSVPAECSICGEPAAGLYLCKVHLSRWYRRCLSSYHIPSEKRQRRQARAFRNREQVLVAIRQIRQQFLADYGEDIGWEVVDASS